MVRLVFTRPHKSIAFLSPIELPDLVILTGVNGAGKSHLLEALENGAVRIEEFPHNPNTRNIRRFDWSTLVPTDSGAFSSYQARQERAQLWSQVTAYKSQYLPPQLGQIVTQAPELANLSLRELNTLTKDSLLNRGINATAADSVLGSIRNVTQSVNQTISQLFIQQDPSNRPRLLAGLQARANLPLAALEEDDFYENFPPTWQPVDMFQQSFARLFSEYQENWRKNKFKQYLNTEGKTYRVLSNDEFAAKFGTPPWEFVNSILETASLGFRINAPDDVDDRPYEPVLTDQLTNVQIKFADLSSGEKILMSFALCLYYARDNRQLVQYPEVLLFDEIDAPLHPSMTESLLKTIQTVLIDQRKLKVIMTTHSPSTVALAPEGSIFVMRKTQSDRLGKASKDGALAVLTTGVPRLSIDYENRRQVFVESHHDVGFYDALYQKVRRLLAPEISLNFISSSGSSVGGSAHVRDIVQKLVHAGSKKVFGIIDWDTVNKAVGHIKVIGEQERYSIESCLFDPVLVAALLFQQRAIPKFELGLLEGETYVDFARFDSERLQSVADVVVSRVALQFGQPMSNETIPCRYIGGSTICVPKWYLHMNGHRLEELIKETFPAFKVFHAEAAMKRAIIERVVDDIPALIPKCVLDAFAAVQEL